MQSEQDLSIFSTKLDILVLSPRLLLKNLNANSRILIEKKLQDHIQCN